MAGLEFEDVTVVRPYGEAIRKQVYAILANCGLRINEHHVIPAKTSDDEVIKVLGRRRSHTLLIPFHGHLDNNKKIVNGVTLYRKLREAIPEMAVNPVLMPADKHSAPVVESLISVAHVKNVLVIPEETLAAPTVLQGKIEEHLAHCRGLR